MSWCVYILSIVMGLIFLSDFSFQTEVQKHDPNGSSFVFLQIEIWSFVVALFYW